MSPTGFRFLNVEGTLAELGWQGAGTSRLWRYNQHYFDDLNAVHADSRRVWHLQLIESWLAFNPPGSGDGWEPYPTSLRIVNWVKAAASGLPLSHAAWHSLAVQTRWLSKRLEWHLLGNHLLVNAKALLVASLALADAPETRQWCKLALEILDEQLPEQVLPDGGQFERSPMYHALALEDVLDLINVTRHWAPEDHPARRRLTGWLELAARMVRVLKFFTHPDGRLAHFNDSAHGIAPSVDELIQYAAALGVPRPNPFSADQGVTHLTHLGYVRIDSAPLVALLDVAPIGPDYLPGHAHADTLSFELSLGERRVVVNGGTSRYGTDALRVAERGTAAHSTVQIGTHDSSEVWSGFRVGRRAYPRDLLVGNQSIAASHDGYCLLPGRPMHRREWTWSRGCLNVSDEVSGPHAARARFHLAPGLTAQPVGATRWAIVAPDGPVCSVEVLMGRGELHPSQHSPEFGLTHKTQCLEVALDNGRARTRWTW